MNFAGQQWEIHGKKRTRVESVHSELNLPEPKRVNHEQKLSGTIPTESQRVKDDYAGFYVNTRDDLLRILSDSDELADRESAIQDLESVIKSLQNEINQPIEAEVCPKSQPDLGYLLEASDDELGLPPVIGSQRTPDLVADSGEPDPPKILSDISYFGFEDEFPSYEFGIVEEETQSGDFVIDRLFSYNEHTPSDQSELPWQRGLTADPTALIS